MILTILAIGAFALGGGLIALTSRMSNGEDLNV